MMFSAYLGMIWMAWHKGNLYIEKAMQRMVQQDDSHWKI